MATNTGNGYRRGMIRGATKYPDNQPPKGNCGCFPPHPRPMPETGVVYEEVKRGKK